MKRLLSGIARASGIALFALSLFAPPALAVDATRQSAVNQRQTRGCMIKRMIADKTLSYNDAKKTCTDQLKAQSNTLAAPLAAAAREGG